MTQAGRLGRARARTPGLRQDQGQAGPAAGAGRRGARTARVHDEPAVAPADGEAPALDAQAGDLALLQQVLQPREVLDAPREAPLERLAAAGAGAGAAAAAQAAARAAGGAGLGGLERAARALPAVLPAEARALLDDVVRRRKHGAAVLRAAGCLVACAES